MAFFTLAEIRSAWSLKTSDMPSLNFRIPKIKTLRARDKNFRVGR